MAVNLLRADPYLWEILELALDGTPVDIPFAESRELSSFRTRWYRFIKAIEQAKTKPMVLDLLSADPARILAKAGDRWAQVVPLPVALESGGLALRIALKSTTSQYRNIQDAILRAKSRPPVDNSEIAAIEGQSAMLSALRRQWEVALREGRTIAEFDPTRPTAWMGDASGASASEGEPEPSPESGRMRWHRKAADGKVYTYARRGLLADGALVDWREEETNFTPAQRDAVKRYY